MNIQYLLSIGLGCLIGAGVTAAIIFPQINNRYEMGVSTGFIQGGNEVITFLDKNINNTLDNNNIIKLKPYLDHKSSRIEIIKINGIKTILIQ